MPGGFCKPFHPADAFGRREGTMVSYHTEVLPLPLGVSAQSVAQQVQVRLETCAAEGWRLSTMAGVAGAGGFFFGGATGPYLVLVFEHA